ncbi:MAG: thymidine phosphorylase [Candidatus Eisenbacteria bacterium]
MSLRMVDLIERKKRGGGLTLGEIRGWVAGITDGSIPDYQTAALLMAIRFRGLGGDETFALTGEMLRSGELLDLGRLGGPTADKHSTGGVGDKLSFIVGPLAAACGVRVPMLSGRALGHTGGTLDKLESIPGYRTRLPTAEFLDVVERVGISIVGQTDRLAPADGKLYALRDVTGTVDSVPLIVSSILSKKLAAGPESLVFDVKSGDGAILEEPERVRELADLLVSVATRMGRRASALLTDMSVPLGRTVGNALEIGESIEALRGGGEADMMEISLALAAEMLLLSGVASSGEEARSRLGDALSSGRALEVFRRMIEAHGGDPAVVDDPGRLPRATIVREVPAPVAGTVLAARAKEIGLTAMSLGAGREKVEDRIDPGAGIELRKRPGDTVSRGEPLALLHGNHESPMESAAARVAAAFRIGPGAPPVRDLVIDRIRATSNETGG